MCCRWRALRSPGSEGENSRGSALTSTIFPQVPEIPQKKRQNSPILGKRGSAGLDYVSLHIGSAGGKPTKNRCVFCVGGCVPMCLGRDLRRDTETAPCDASGRLARSGRRAALRNGNLAQRVRARRRGRNAPRLRVAARRVAGSVQPTTTGNPASDQLSGRVRCCAVRPRGACAFIQIVSAPCDGRCRPLVNVAVRPLDRVPLLT